MSEHMTWGLVGFALALLYVGVYHLLRTRGVRYFWQHPLFACFCVLLALYVVESFLFDLSAATLYLNWDTIFYVGVPVFLLACLLLYRRLRRPTPS